MKCLSWTLIFQLFQLLVSFQGRAFCLLKGEDVEQNGQLRGIPTQKPDAGNVQVSIGSFYIPRIQDRRL